ncbi:MAG: hypothetical protein V3S69_05080 [Dehalococcoidales bacterium]
MANINSSVKATPGSVNEGALQKREATIKFQDIIDAANAASSVDDDTITYTIPVEAGEEVVRVGVRLDEAFDDSGAGSTLTVVAGDGSDADGYITSAELHVDGTEISWVANTGALVVGGASARGKLYTSDDTIDILLTPSSYNLNELTQGKAVVTAYIAKF